MPRKGQPRNYPTYPPRGCDYCKREFIPKAYWQIYCSSECRIVSHGIRKIEARKAGALYEAPPTPQDNEERIKQSRDAVNFTARKQAVKPDMDDIEALLNFRNADPLHRTYAPNPSPPGGLKEFEEALIKAKEKQEKKDGQNKADVSSKSEDATDGGRTEVLRGDDKEST